MSHRGHIFADVAAEMHHPDQERERLPTPYDRARNLARTTNQREDHTHMMDSPDTQDQPDNLPNYADDEGPLTESSHPRSRGPATYDVYRQNADLAWEFVGEGIEAPNRRGAVVATFKKLGTDPTADEAFGQFLVVRSNEAKVLTREKKVIPETIADDWS